ncbi:MAG: maleylacetoacetate isomerase [Gammaproteobacteria bacterium]|nr:maleylacetoacetate isomerase [Gammaproteobacteria bacterium]
MRLFTYFRSSAAYRVRIALNLKGLAYESVPRDFMKNGGEHRLPEFLALNPQGLIPVLEDGQTVVSQSLAIMEYLDETHPQVPLLPAGPAARAQVRAMCQLIACDVHPLNNLRVLQYLKTRMGQNEISVATWYRHWIGEGFAALETLVQRHSNSGEVCFGDRISMADACLVPQIYNARRFDTDLAPYPGLCGVSAKLESLLPFKQAAPENQADAR